MLSEVVGGTVDEKTAIDFMRRARIDPIGEKGVGFPYLEGRGT